MKFQDTVHATLRCGDSGAVLRMAEAERLRARVAGDPAGEVVAIDAMTRVALRGEDLARAEELALEALGVAVGSGDRRLEERPRHVLAAVAHLSGDYRTAHERYLASIELYESLGQPEMVNSERHNLAFIELRLGNRDRARRLFAAVREWVFRAGHRSFVPHLGVAAAVMASADGEHQRAARMIGFTDRADAIARLPDPDETVDLSRARSAAVAALGAERFAVEYAAGAILSPEEAFGLEWRS
ncbi:hypothetical protein DMB66_42030 [Actinoplanes sp. ATCC 53533]|uniref:tetratricopeptide repeat protein n=1 Tax=Actinoplanes sp. ATCC 53533 TaxID=1288362 RepID=UPI000F7B5DCC|nr:tetratricopeptide repeat protein [Actinoplanes sp. ATCC 53533]RSM51352.1 hypothetical protein DMB66_42030 [Actinoplanes sp. ATCC 53533]